MATARPIGISGGGGWTRVEIFPVWSDLGYYDLTPTDVVLSAPYRMLRNEAFYRGNPELVDGTPPVPDVRFPVPPVTAGYGERVRVPAAEANAIVAAERGALA